VRVCVCTLVHLTLYRLSHTPKAAVAPAMQTAHVRAHTQTKTHKHVHPPSLCAAAAAAASIDVDCVPCLLA
jgi:hypothetical protein